MALPVRSSLLLTAALLVGGCGNLNPIWAPGGPYASIDSGVIESTSMEPKTWILVDKRTGQTVRTVEVPVGKKFIYKFYKGEGDANQVTPDILAWEIVDPSVNTGEPQFRMPVPGAADRYTEWFYRPAPELPPEMQPTDVPMPTPGQPAALPADMKPSAPGVSPMPDKAAPPPDRTGNPR